MNPDPLKLVQEQATKMEKEREREREYEAIRQQRVDKAAALIKRFNDDPGAAQLLHDAVDVGIVHWA